MSRMSRMRKTETDRRRNAGVPRCGFEPSCTFVRLISVALILRRTTPAAERSGFCRVYYLDHVSYPRWIYATETPPIRRSRRNTTA